MEKLTISIPNQKIDLVKQILKGMGVLIQGSTNDIDSKSYREKLSRISTWADKDIQELENAKSAFSSFKAEEW